MVSPAGPRVVIPQAYPLWVTWYSGVSTREPESWADLVDMTDDEVDAMVREEGAFLVVAWEYEPDTVPEPIVAEIGRGEGMAHIGLTADEAIAKARAAAHLNRKQAKQWLRAREQGQL
jgi:hypothetical protein